MKEQPRQQLIDTLPRLSLPPAHLRVKLCSDGIRRIYDRLRDKFVALTPEEWVRQNFTAYLIDALGYPAPLMANEVALTFNGQRRRCDTVLFGGRPPVPYMIVEDKAPEVEITQRVFDQIARYNLVMGARVLVVSNGLRHFCCVSTAGRAAGNTSNGAAKVSNGVAEAPESAVEAACPPYRFISELPSYDELRERFPI